MFEGCFKIVVTASCPYGYGYVKDLYGNLIYYGLLKDCCVFIEQMEKRDE